MTQHDVWKQLVHGIKQEDNESMEQGREWEPDIINIYRRRSGRWVSPNTSPEGQVTRARSWLHATPDAFSKSEDEEASWSSGVPFAPGSGCDPDWTSVDAKKSNDDPWPVLPEYYALQAQVQMYCWHEHVNSADFAALFPWHQFRVYPLSPNPELQGQLNDTAEKFIKDYVLPKKLPPVDASESCRQAIIAQWPKEESGEYLEPSSEIMECLLSIKELEPELDELTGLIDTKKNQLRAFIGERAGINFGSGRADFKRNKGSEKVDHHGLLMELLIKLGDPAINKLCEELRKKHTRETVGARVLRIYWQKGGES
jgi:hypothetical protein